MEWYHDFPRFLKLFKEHGEAMDETAFYFRTDTEESEHFIGFIADYEKQYWIGYCDVPDGCEFETAEALFDAKVFDGRSLRERWEEVVICQINGFSEKSWAEYNLLFYENE